MRARFDDLPGGPAKPVPRSRLLTVVAFVLATVTTTAAYYALRPTDWEGPGRLGAVVLIFPLHILLVSLVGLTFALLAWYRKAWLAMALFSVVVTVTVLSAIWPCAAVAERAKQLGIPISLGVYLEHAMSPNIGDPSTDRSMVYGTTPDGTKLVLDVWAADTGRVARATAAVPAGPGGARPAVVFIHGGGWSSGHRSMYPEWDRWLNRLGYHVFDIDYRMAPPVRWQDEVGDVKSALGWIVRHAAHYGVDTTRISTMGNSAGGNLAMLAAYSMGDPDLPPSTDVGPVAVRSVVNLYGPAHLPLLYESSGSLDYVRRSLRDYIGGGPAEYPDRYRALSPISRVEGETPPTITILGTSDRLIPLNQAVTLDHAFVLAGAPHETVLLPGSDHGFDVNWGGFATQIARARIERFLREHDAARGGP
jgi:acetyl esterase/lipase